MTGSVQRVRDRALPEELDRVNLNHVNDLTLKDYERGQGTLHSFETAWSEISTRWDSPSYHPWSWVKAVLSPFDQEELVLVTRNWRNRIADLLSFLNNTSIQSLNLIPTAPTRVQLDAVHEMLNNFSNKTPERLSNKLMKLLDNNDFRIAVSNFQNLWKQRDALQKKCSLSISIPIGIVRHQELDGLAELVANMGVHDQSVSDLEEIVSHANQVRKDWQEIQKKCEDLTSQMEFPPCNTFSDLKLLLDAISFISGTPRSVVRLRREKLAEKESRKVIEWARDYSHELSRIHGILERQFDMQRANSFAECRKNAYVLRNTNFLGRFGSRYRQAKACWWNLTLEPRRTSPEQKASDLESLASHLEELHAFASHRKLRELLDPGFDGVKTDFEIYIRVLEFMTSAQQLTAGTDPLRVALRTFLLTPVLNGYEAFKRIINKDGNAKIVFTSGYAIDNEQFEEAKKLGLCGLLPKPVEINSMIKIIEKSTNEIKL